MSSDFPERGRAVPVYHWLRSTDHTEAWVGACGTEFSDGKHSLTSRKDRVTCEKCKALIKREAKEKDDGRV